MPYKSTRELGQEAEKIACRHLEALGFTFLTANWSCRLGEIDLVMQHGSTRVFVEVRLRNNAGFGSGADSITHRKQQRLIRTAHLYQQQTNYWQDSRFDVVSIAFPKHAPPEIEHIPHAFDVAH